MSRFLAAWCFCSIWTSFAFFQVMGQGLGEYSCESSMTYLQATSVPRRLSFPEHDNKYPNDCQRQWRITASSGKVRIDVTKLELEGLKQVCQYDVLIIYDVNQLVKLCGSVTDYSFTSVSNSVQLNFTSDGSITREGFELTYVKENLDRTSNLIATEKYQYLTYPPFGYYSNNADVKWRIASSNYSTKVQLRFEDLDIEEEANCDYDALTIYDGYDSHASILEKACGKLGPRRRSQAITSTSQYVFLHFTSNMAITRRGFSIQYITESMVPTCNSNPNAVTYLDAAEYEQEMTSPNFPGHYPSNCKAQWRIFTYQERVKFTIQDFNLEYGSGCVFDSLTFYDGYDDSARILKKLCGRILDQNSRTFYSSSNYVFISFVTDSRLEYSGFQISFTAEDEKEDSNIRPALVAGIIGGICVFILLVGLAFAVIRRHRRQQQQRQSQQQHSSGRPSGSQSPGVYVLNPSAPPPPYATLNHAYVHEEPPPSYSEANLYIVDPHAPPLYSMLNDVTAAGAPPATLSGADVTANDKEHDDHNYSNEPGPLRLILPDHATNLSHSQVPHSDQGPQPIDHEHRPHDEQLPDYLSQEHHAET